MAETPNRQKLLLGILLVAGLGYVGYTYLYTPKAAEIGVMEDRLETLQIRNQTARTLATENGEEAIQERLADYQYQLSQVEGLIPSSEELPNLLDAISMEAQRTGVELALIQPTGATGQSFYTRRTYALAVLGSYHQIADFLTRVGSLPRIITPTDLQLTIREAEGRDGRPELEARFSIETYVLPNSMPQVQPEAVDVG